MAPKVLTPTEPVLAFPEPGTQDTPEDTQQCRVRVCFEGHDPLDYVASVDVAKQFAAAAGGVGARVIIDQELSTGLRPLPCERLWKV